MDYNTDIKLKWWHYFIVLAVILVFFYFYFEIPIKELILSGGLFSWAVAIFYNISREKEFENKTKELLISELKYNLRCVNSDIRILEEYKKTKKEKDEFYYLDRIVFDCLINSGNLVLLPEEVRFYLFNFYRAVNTINRILDQSDRFYQIAERGGRDSDFVLDIFKKAKKNLKVVFGHLEEYQLYEELKQEELKGLKFEA